MTARDGSSQRATTALVGHEGRESGRLLNLNEHIRRHQLAVDAFKNVSVVVDRDVHGRAPTESEMKDFNERRQQLVNRTSDLCGYRPASGGEAQRKHIYLRDWHKLMPLAPDQVGVFLACLVSTPKAVTREGFADEAR